MHFGEGGHEKKSHLIAKLGLLKLLDFSNYEEYLVSYGTPNDFYYLESNKIIADLVRYGLR